MHREVHPGRHPGLSRGHGDHGEVTGQSRGSHGGITGVTGTGIVQDAHPRRGGGAAKWSALPSPLPLPHTPRLFFCHHGSTSSVFINTSVQTTGVEIIGVAKPARV